jgi:inner membrane protein
MPGVGRPERERPVRAGREARIDPVCHTLAGAALSRSGLGKRTALGTTALILGANLPDLDVLAYFAGPQADLEWRRGWTHGILALALLPLVLTGSLLLIHRARRRLRIGTTGVLAPKQLLLLSFAAILSHPILDTLNTYGVRWLMPWSGTWFYGDTLFIIDPWVWVALAVGLYASRTGNRPAGNPGPVRLALVAVVLYTSAMALSGWAARTITIQEVARSKGKPVVRAMAGPAPIDPLVRRIVVEQESEYGVGTFRWLSRPHVEPRHLRTFPRGRPSHPAFQAAVGTAPARRFLTWARFPTFRVEQVSAGKYLVHMVDLRYADSPDDSFGALTVPITLRSASAPPPGSRAPSSAAAPALQDP